MTPQVMRDVDEFLEGMRLFQKWQPEGVMGSDIDYIIEAGHGPTSSYLIAEFKRAGQPVPAGQKRLLRALARDLPDATVVTCHYDKDRNTVFLSGAWSGTVSLKEFGHMVGAWWAEKKGL